MITSTRSSWVRPLCAALLAVAAGSASAVPVATSLSRGVGFATASVPGAPMTADASLLVLADRTVGALQSWLVVFHPLRQTRVQATIDFGAPIQEVWRDPAAAAGTDLVSPDPDPQVPGLEPADLIEWTVGGSTLTLDWTTGGPGDAVRVVTADLPEPSSAALALLALGVLPWMRRRIGR